MNRHDIRQLQKIKGSPAVTITLPTSRSAPENEQDPIRVKNLVKQAADRLMREFPEAESVMLLLELGKLVESIDYRTAQDGLAMFVNRDLARAVHLPFPLKERVSVDKSFLTRDLIFAMNRAPRYWTLVLNEKLTRLFEGTCESLIEIQRNGFPFSHTGPGGTRPLPTGFGIRRSAFWDERHRQFFRQVDSALKPIMAGDMLPLVEVGMERNLEFFDEVTVHKESILARLTDSHDETTPDELSLLVWPLVKAGLAEQRLQVLAELAQAMGDKKCASTVGDVWRLAREGRGKLLLVEEDFHFPARLDETGERLQVADDPAAPDVMEDAVDEIIEIVLSKKGQVVFVDNGRLAAHQRIALVLRD